MLGFSALGEVTLGQAVGLQMVLPNGIASTLSFGSPTLGTPFLLVPVTPGAVTISAGSVGSLSLSVSSAGALQLTAASAGSLQLASSSSGSLTLTPA